MMNTRLTYCSIMLITCVMAQQQYSIAAPIFENMACGSEGVDLYCHSNKFSGDRIQFAERDGPRHPEYYETVDLVFDGGRLNITSPFLEKISSLFQRGPSRRNEFRVKFQNFEDLNLHDQIFSKIFNEPSADNDITLNVYNSNLAGFRISPNVFDGLRADDFVIHNADMSSVPFQTLFKNSYINTLDLKGAYLNSDESIPFTGHVDKVILTKQASVLGAEEFPKFPVREYIINAQNVQSVDGESFQGYNNVVGLNIKSDLLSLGPGDFKQFNKLRRLQLEGVSVRGNALGDLQKLEELEIGPRVTMEPQAISDIGDLHQLRKLIVAEGGQLSSDVRQMCELATAISQLASSLIQIDIPSVDGKCTCEHKYLAHLKGLHTHPCYNYEADCTQTTCPIVNQYFNEDGQTTATVEDYGSKVEATTSEFYQNKTERENTEEMLTATTVVETSRVVETTQLGSIKQVGDRPAGKGRGLSKMNWLPIVIVTAILLFILICGIVAYLIRMRSDKNKEFRPIPSHETSSGGGKGPTARG